MRPPSVSTAERLEPPRRRAGGVQWAAIDWCARLRPNIWLHAAGLTDDAEHLRRHRPVDRPAALDAMWPTLNRSAESALAARQACWRDVTASARQIGDSAVAVLAVMASTAWPSAVAAAGYLAARATRVAGIPDPAGVVFRTFAIPDGPGVGWDQAWDVARDAACIVTCQALGGLVSASPTTWATAGGEAWPFIGEAVERALDPVRAELARSAVGWMEPGL
jgi:hypothetical protein